MAISETDSILQQSIKHHTTFYRVQWGGSIIAGLCFGVVLVAVPAKPGELAAKFGVGVIAALFFFGGLYARSWVNKTVAGITDLLVRRPQDAKTPTLVVFRRNGVVAAHAVEVTDRDNKKYRLRVQSEQAANHLLRNAAPQPQ